MADAVWGLVGIIVGAAGKGLLDWALAIGKVRADREARAEARKDKRAERRADLQRDTLLHTQDAVLRILMAAHQRLDVARAQEKAGNPWQIREIAWSEDGRTAALQLRLLRSRIANSELRNSVLAFTVGVLKELDKQETEDSASISLATAREAASEIFNRTGQQIREIDDVS